MAVNEATSTPGACRTNKAPTTEEEVIDAPGRIRRRWTSLPWTIRWHRDSTAGLRRRPCLSRANAVSPPSTSSPARRMESQSGLQMLRPRIYGAYEAPPRRPRREDRRDRHAPDEQLHGPLPDRAARRARHRLPGPQLALRRQRHGAADGARDPGPRRRRQVPARALGCERVRAGRQLGRRRARRVLPGRRPSSFSVETHGRRRPDAHRRRPTCRRSTASPSAPRTKAARTCCCAGSTRRSIDEHDALSVDPGARHVRRAPTGADGANPIAYAPRSWRRFMAAQRARRDRIEARVLERLVELRAHAGRAARRDLRRLPHPRRSALPRPLARRQRPRAAAASGATRGRSTTRPTRWAASPR